MKFRKYEKEIYQSQLDNEKAVLKRLEASYEDALTEIEDRLESLTKRNDAELPNVIYRIEYQKALQEQIKAVLDELHSHEFKSVSDFLEYSYEEGFCGAMYSMHRQGVPLVIPIDQKLVVAAVQHETQLTSSLYTEIGKDMGVLKKQIAGEISRGIAGGMEYREIIRNIAVFARIPLNRAMTITRTEAHRISETANAHAQNIAKEKGARLKKIWDSTLDGKTREAHMRMDGEIRELEERFSNGLMYPGEAGGEAKEVINCRCRSRTEAEWALDDEETRFLGNVEEMTETRKKEIAGKLGIASDELKAYSEQIVTLKSKNFKEFKEQYKKAAQEILQVHRLLFPEEVYVIAGFTKEIKEEVDTAMKKLNNEYEIRLNSIVVEPARKGDILVTGYHDGLVDMVVNEKADFDKIKRRAVARYKSGEFAGKSLEDYLAHEMAHCMVYQDCKTDAEYGIRYQLVESLYSSLKGISHYADRMQSGNEALAEAFVRVRNKEKVPAIVKLLVDTYIGKWKK